MRTYLLCSVMISPYIDVYGLMILLIIGVALFKKSAGLNLRAKMDHLFYCDGLFISSGNFLRTEFFSIKKASLLLGLSLYLLISFSGQKMFFSSSTQKNKNSLYKKNTLVVFKPEVNQKTKNKNLVKKRILSKKKISESKSSSMSPNEASRFDRIWINAPPSVVRN